MSSAKWRPLCLGLNVLIYLQPNLAYPGPDYPETNRLATKVSGYSRFDCRIMVAHTWITFLLLKTAIVLDIPNSEHIVNDKHD